MDEAPSFGALLRRARKGHGWTQDELATRIGCSLALIRKLESGERRPSRQVAALLAEQLGLAPAARAGFLQLARPEPPGGDPAGPPGLAPAAPAPSPPSPRPLTNLPTILTPLIGREQAIAAAAGYLRGERVRLLTLTGPPGIGKTRLSQAVAAALRDAFPDGVFFVNLAPITDPALVATTIAQAIGLQESGGQGLAASLDQFLQPRRLLLVLDNFEQVLPATALVIHLLAGCPGVKFLVTSREALHVRGEQQFPVPSLTVPDLLRLPSVEILPDYSALAFFVDRARAVQPDFALTAENAPAVAEVCARLDGLPLAIELAAARSRLLPPSALLARMEHRLPLLASGPRDLPARQQTLRAAISWSYDLLEPAEQALFRRLGVFVGGAPLAAIEAIGNAAGDLPFDIMNGLAALIDKSLLRQEADDDGETRFTMLETIREYAQERLDASGEAATVHTLHGEFYLALAADAATHNHDSQQIIWMDRLERDQANIRGALSWALERGAAQMALRLTAGAWWFWYVQNHVGEGRAWLARALALPGAAALTPARAEALRGAAWLAWTLDELPTARAEMEESLALWRALGEQDSYTVTTSVTGMIALAQGDVPAAQARMDEGLARARHSSNHYVQSITALSRGILHRVLGDTVQALPLLTHAVTIARSVGDWHTLASTLMFLGRTLLETAEYAQAAACFAEGMDVFHRAHMEFGTALGLMGLAGVAASQGQAERAARLFGADEALRDTIGGRMDLLHRADYERDVARTRAQLDNATFRAAWAAGRAMSLAQALAYAHEQVVPVGEGR